MAFLPLPAGFLAWFAFVPLLSALDARRARGVGARGLFALGYAFGLAFFLIGVHWIAALSDVAITVPWLKYPAWLTAAAYLALYPGLAVAAAGVLARRAALPLALVFPPVLLAVEALRAAGELGFPWFQPGYTQHAYPALLQMAGLGGVSLVTLWLALVNVAIWRALAGRRRAASAGAALLLVAGPWLAGQRVLAAAPDAPGPVVALVQGNIPGEKKWSGRHQEEILATFLTLSARAVREGAAPGGPGRPQLLVWPETATGSYLARHAEQSAAVAGFVARTGVPVLTGFADFDHDAAGRRRHLNAAGRFGPAGLEGETYAKRHLVPFGERMPFQRWIPALGRIALGQAEWTPGTRTVLLPGPGGPLACLICFESIFADLARADVRAGARALVNITNDEWFGHGAALYQHAAMAPLRAVENRVPLARCANTGLTLLIDAYGRVRARLPVWEEAVLVAPLPPAGPPTPFTRLGDWPAALAGAAVALCALRAWRRRGAAGARA